MISCTENFLSVIIRYLVVVIAVSLSGMYIICESDYHRRGWDHRARSI